MREREWRRLPSAKLRWNHCSGTAGQTRASGENDYKIWGWQNFWILTRFLYLPVGILSLVLYRWDFFKRHYELPSLIPTAYVAAFVTWFITLSGYEASPHIHGMNKLLLALSVLPYSVGSYVVLFSLCNLLPILVITFHYGSFHFYANSQLSFLFSYSVLSVLVYCSVNFVRRQLYVTTAELAMQKQQQEHIIADQAEKLARSRTAESIARATQMLVHDIRKPFTMMQSVLRILQDEMDPSAMKSAATTFLPEVQKAQRKVNVMLDDIILVGGRAKMHSKIIGFREILATCIADISQIHQGPEISFVYHFDHEHKICVDPVKIGRVLENILINALQAMPHGGMIAVRTKETKTLPYQLEVSINNSGSYIPVEDQLHIFDAFFTKGKRDGTGLGLAICKTIVEAHGGQIHCASSQEEGTSFILTLPLTKDVDHAGDVPLPANIKHMHPRPVLNRRSELLAKDLQVHGRKLKLLFVDDEDVYRQSFQRLVTSLPDIQPYLELSEARTVNEANQIMSLHDPDIVIIDLDLDNSSGLDVLANARHHRSRAFLCLHSNRSLVDLQQLVVENKADVFIPKPLVPEHFIKILLDATARMNVSSTASMRH